LIQRFESVSDTKADGAPSISKILHVDENAQLKTEDEADEQFSHALREFAQFIDSDVRQDSQLLSRHLIILADASRDIEILRSFYGLRCRPSDEENAVQIHAAEPPDCVLELARREVERGGRGGSSEVECRRQALRIIANCCACNNQNRSLVIGRGGVGRSRQIAFDGEDLDLVVPCLYNVCMDFDEGAYDSDGKHIETSDKMEAGLPAMLSKAEQALGRFDESAGKTAVERFLQLAEKVDPDSLPVLADVVEMSSRAALYGLTHILGELDLNTTQPSMATLFSALTTQGPLFAPDEDARAAICQTYMNILSQLASQKQLAQSPNDLAVLAHFPWLDFSGKDMYTEGCLKLVYTITSLPDYADTATPTSKFISNAVQQIKDGPILTPNLVFVANALTSPALVSEFHTRYPLASTLVEILGGTRNAGILLPTLSICSRLTIIPAGQDDLCTAGILGVLTKIIFPNNSSGSVPSLAPTSTREESEKQDQILQIHRESLALIRLVVKHKDDDDGQHAYAKSLLSAPVSSPSLLSRLVDLASTTIDAQSKLEIGRVVVEVLRGVMRRTGTFNPVPVIEDNCERDAVDGAGAPDAEGKGIVSDLHLSLLTRQATIDAVMFLLTDAPNIAVTAEGLFGLGLISRIPSDDGRKNIIASLSKQRDKVLQIFRDVMSRREGMSGNGGVKAEVGNLMFLLSNLLKGEEVEGRGGEESGEGEFVRELRGVAREMGLSEV
jgi:hypothetical protein